MRQVRQIIICPWHFFGHDAERETDRGHAGALCGLDPFWTIVEYKAEFGILVEKFSGLFHHGRVWFAKEDIINRHHVRDEPHHLPYPRGFEQYFCAQGVGRDRHGDVVRMEVAYQPFRSHGEPDPRKSLLLVSVVHVSHALGRFGESHDITKNLEDVLFCDGTHLHSRRPEPFRVCGHSGELQHNSFQRLFDHILRRDERSVQIEDNAFGHGETLLPGLPTGKPSLGEAGRVLCYDAGMSPSFLARSLVLVALTLGCVSPLASHAALVGSGSLIKASSPVVYFFSGDKRYVFANESVYRSWFDDFNDVKVVTDAGLASLPLGGNVTYRPQTLVKLATDPKVYVIESPNRLHWVVSEDIARQRFGDDWNQKIEYLSDVQFSDYKMGEPMTSPILALSSRYVPRNVSGLSFMLEEREGGLSPEPDTASISFPKPPSLAESLTSADGYAATSTQSVSELHQWFMAQSSGWSMNYSFVTSTPQGDMALLSFERPRGDETARRSVALIHSARDQETEKGTTVMFQEATFPNGYPFYPSAATIFQQRQKGIVGHLAATNRPGVEVSAWYRQTLTADGWTLTDIPLDPSEDSTFTARENVHAEHRGRGKILEYRIIDLKDIFSTLFAPVPEGTTSFTFITQTWTPGVE